METCDLCGTAIDYENTVFRVDIQEWWLNKATGKKLTLCPECGTELITHVKEKHHAM